MVAPSTSHFFSPGALLAVNEYEIIMLKYIGKTCR